MTITATTVPGGTYLSQDVYYGGFSVSIDRYIPNAPAVAAPAPANVSASTGVSPLETSYALYGHIIPLSVFGRGRIGCEIIAGPWVQNGLASFIVSAGVPADPTGTRVLEEIAFDSQVIWTGSLSGSGTPSSSGFTTEVVNCRFYDGNLTQAADTLESTHFGVDAVAYRPQILLAISNLPIASQKFGKIPYVALLLSDTSGTDVNLGEAFERLAYSPWVQKTTANFETSGITDALVDGGLIIASDVEFLSLIQQFGRFYRSWDILQTDKLRIVDRGANVTADITLNKTMLLDQVTFQRSEPDSVPRELELSTVDPSSDYTIVPSKASFPRDPVNVSSSVATESVYLPMIMDSSTRIAVVTYAQYAQEVSRKTVSATAMIYGLEIEPGDIVGFSDLGNGFNNEGFKVVETLHGANYTVEFTAQAILNCDLTDPHLIHVVLLMGFEDVNLSAGAPGLTDESPSAHGTGTFAPSGPAISTAKFKYGSSSLLVTDGLTSREVIFAASTDWVLATSNSDQFTIEAAINMNSLPGVAPDFGCIVSYGLTVVWDFSTLVSGEFRFRYSSDNVSYTTVTSSGAGLLTGNWYQLAVDKDATGKIRLYKNGVMLGSSTPADSSIFNASDDLIIGASGLFGNAGLDGYIDELRITKGVARYASDAGYTAPTSAFPRV